MDYAYVTNMINVKSAVSDRLKIKSNKGIQKIVTLLLIILQQYYIIKLFVFIISKVWYKKQCSI